MGKSKCHQVSTKQVIEAKANNAMKVKQMTKHAKYWRSCDYELRSAGNRENQKRMSLSKEEGVEMLTVCLVLCLNLITAATTTAAYFPSIAEISHMCRRTCMTYSSDGEDSNICKWCKTDIIVADVAKRATIG